MIRLREAVSLTLSFGGRVATLLVVVAILLGVFSRHDPVPPRDVQGPGPGRFLVRDEDGTLRLTMDDAERGVNSRCVLQDRSGRVLMHVQSSESGSIWFYLAESPTVSASGWRSANGEFGLGVADDSLVFEYSGRPDGPPGVRLYNHVTSRHSWYRITPEGGLIRDLTAPEQ
jgi:hypothetical protein